MAFKLFVVTGIPGTRVKLSLQGLVKYAHDRDQIRVRWTSLDEEVFRLAKPYVAKTWGATESRLAPLLLPRPFLRKIWCDAFHNVWNGAEGVRDGEGNDWQGMKYALQESNVILTSHLCYFHHLTREYLLPSDTKLLIDKLTGATSSIVTFIDDIYDCHRHLFARQGRFSSPGTVDDALLALLTVLDWRSKEILASDALAASCGVSHYVFAVKHPVETFFDLLFSEKPKLYLSHPISEPRRLVQAGKIDEARAIASEIDALVAKMQSKYVVFEPTSIDELRFKPSDNGVLGNLDLRWPFGHDGPKRDLLFVPPKKQNSSVAYPVGWDEDSRDLIPSSLLVNELVARIKAQITARDHKLVEQSEVLACIKPLFQGNRSGGVEEEIRHVSLLMNLGVRKKEHLAIVFHPPEDQAQYPVRQLSDAVVRWQREGALSGSPEDALRLAITIRKQEVQRLSEVLNGGEEAFYEMCREYSLEVVPQSGGNLAEGPMGTSDEVRRDFATRRLAHSLKDYKKTYLDEFAEQGVVHLKKSKASFLSELEY